MMNSINWINIQSFGASAVKNSPANAGDTGSIPGLGRSPEDLPGYSIHGVFQARVLEWGAIAFFDHLHSLCS